MKSMSVSVRKTRDISQTALRLNVACMSTKGSKPASIKPLNTKQHGIDILQNPLWNKALAFSPSERDRLGIRGLIPPGHRSITDQVERTLTKLRELPDNPSRNLFLQELHNRNETLYHRLLVDNIEEIAPLVYTPTVGYVCQQFGFKFTRPRGMYFSRADRGEFSTMLHNWPHDDVHVIVVTDGSRILGLGDLGVHGMGIPIGKLALYCAAGGIAPHRVLPVTLDVGTNNEQLLSDPDYIGTREKRLEGDEYYEFIDEFMQSVYERWPNVVVQFEDFETPKAVPILEKYRYKYRCFNDDIQGTGCVTLAGVMSSAKNANLDIKDMRFVCAGAGSAGLGVCAAIVDGMVHAGLTKEEAMSRFLILNSKGALGAPGGPNGDPSYTRGLNENPLTKEWMNHAVPDGTSILDAVKLFKPTCLLGLSTVRGIFSEEVVRTLASQCERPIIMPMSNPTTLSECTAEEAFNWTDGRAIVATGSPFAPVEVNGVKHIPSQCNNMYVFPGIGLAASVAGIKIITDKMLYVAAKACAESINESEIAEGRTFPKLNRIRDVSFAVAKAVIEEGIVSKNTTKVTQKDIDEGIEKLIARKMYYPDYVPLIGKSA